jgi:hypothetical protein
MPQSSWRRRGTANFAATGAFFLLGLGLTACSKQSAPEAGATASTPATSAEAAPMTSADAGQMHDMGAHDTAAHDMAGHDMAAEETAHSHESGAAHLDHDSKHGGIFFMALDESHHLEGALLDANTFRVFLYDDHTVPLSKEQVAQADARVTWGSQDNAPETVMKPSADGLTLEAAPPSKLTLPVELTLRVRFPGAAANSRPELFTFPFKAFTHDPTTHKH